MGCFFTISFAGVMWPDGNWCSSLSDLQTGQPISSTKVEKEREKVSKSGRNWKKEENWKRGGETSKKMKIGKM